MEKLNVLIYTKDEDYNPLGSVQVEFFQVDNNGNETYIGKSISGDDGRIEVSKTALGGEGARIVVRNAKRLSGEDIVQTSDGKYSTFIVSSDETVQKVEIVFQIKKKHNINIHVTWK